MENICDVIHLKHPTPLNFPPSAGVEYLSLSTLVNGWFILPCRKSFHINMVIFCLIIHAIASMQQRGVIQCTYIEMLCKDYPLYHDSSFDISRTKILVYLWGYL